MAKPIQQALRELKLTLLQVNILTWFLDTLVVFLVSNLAFFLLTLPLLYALIPTGIYAIVHGYHGRKKVTYKHVEEKVPELKEQLITAADNTDKEYEIVESLNKDVLKGMKHTMTSYFFSFGKLSRELFLLFVVAFLIIGASAYNVRFLDTHKAIQEVKEFARNSKEYEIDETLLAFEEGNPDEDEIYGEKSIAELGNEQLQLELNPIKSDADISKVKEPEHRKFRSTVPTEIAASTDASYEESIPKGYQKIVKSYFREITKEN
ncbi:hypothetical protein KY338_03565 [Candidatus Woesearchaeota archaeon]|nr:hypothetical protein [Candidatus Woesearchaeota archaeon]MBW3005318.1 hypothetical protein [Candidatus Woesearchaeota archaeon]